MKSNPRNFPLYRRRADDYMALLVKYNRTIQVLSIVQGITEEDREKCLQAQ
jgi:hypothetical protein